ncbi:hypothetical protein TRVL_05500 [Trypanosoma vivax]|nr:hypothetical protein TRVL_05500 [Trypanosoma vivax]
MLGVGTTCDVAFNDSSDDEEITHTARVVTVLEGSSTQGALQFPSTERTSWMQKIVDGGTSLLVSTIFGRRSLGSNEPFHVAQVSPSTLSAGAEEGEDWGSRAHLDSQAHTRVQSSFPESVCTSEGVAVDLHSAILQYRRTPSDFYMRIIQAALSSGGVQINGYAFQAAAGNKELVETLLKSGNVNMDDAVVQRVIQEEIDTNMVSDPACGGRINPENIEYLKMLCRAPKARLTQQQARSCRYAGFEFAKMLYDNPHLLQNLPPPTWLLGCVLDICFVLDMLLTWVGLIAVLLHHACVAWMVYTWNVSQYTYGSYWTILCYVVGYVVSIVAVMVSEEDRIRDYEDRLWNYPDNTLKVVPCIPLFEIALMYVTLRYELLKEKAKYFVIRFDLYNGLSNVLFVDTFFFATPQLLLQYYLVSVRRALLPTSHSYTVLTGVGYTLYAISMYIFFRKATFNFSCNCFGFAVVAKKQSVVKSGDITTRMLIVTTSFYLHCNMFAALFTLISPSGCSLQVVAITATGVAMIVIQCTALIVAFVFNVTRIVWIACWPAAIVQVVFTLTFTSIQGSVKEGSTCELYSLAATSVPPLTYAALGFLCLSFVVWIGVLLYDRVMGKQQVVRWDNYYFWLRHN